MTEVTFTEVGRKKLTWTATMKTVSYRTLMAEIRKHSALMSSDVQFDLDAGVIFAGFHSVGKISAREIV